MSYVINVSGHGPAPDDLRAAFGDLVTGLRAVTPPAEEGGSLSAALSTGAATYTDADVPDEPVADDEPEED